MDQLHKGTNFYVETDKAIELAEAVVSAVPCGEKVRFTSSGSDANFYAMRLARAFTGKEKILKFEGAYHGFYDSAMLSSQFADPTAVKRFPEVTIDSAGIPEMMKTNVLSAPFNDADTAKEIINDNQGDLAAVVVEPLQRTIPPIPDFLEEIREITSKNGIVLIFDEIVTGFRLAYGGAQEYYGVIPDIACVGKSFAGGLPIGAVCGRSEIMDRLNPQRGYSNVSVGTERVFMLGTFNGNPMSCAAGVATLKELREPGVYDRLNSWGDRLRAEMRSIFERYDMMAQVHGDGSVTGFTFTDREVVDFRSEATGDQRIKEKVTQGLLKRLVFAPYKLYSSTAHSTGELDFTVKALEDTMKSLKDEGVIP